MTYSGTLKRVDLGAGAWVLETRSGEKITLFGDVPAALEGCSVEVSGKEISDGASFVMTGDKMVEVSKVRSI
jgi:hypothetical protein